MMHEEVKKYRELSGDTNPNTPISRIGGYLDGYEKALEQESCEDAISREAARDLMYQRQEPLNEYMLDSLPSVQPIRPRGHWIRETNGYGASDYRCSECGHWHPTMHHSLGFNFCNYCGADMREETNHE